MTESEEKFLRDKLSKISSYLEYGSGGSTALACGYENLECIVSVEADRDFFMESVAGEATVARAKKDGILFTYFPKIGALGGWSTPTDNKLQHLWPVYPVIPYQFHDESFDVVFIDGRFRVACCLVSAMHLPAAEILLHDFTNRPHYRILKKFFDVIETVDSLVQLKRKANFNEEAAILLMKHYMFEASDQPVTKGTAFRYLASGVKNLIGT